MTKFNTRGPFGRLRRLSENNKAIARGMLLVGGLALAAKLVGALKEVVIAWRYGVSEVVDAYLFVFNLLSLPVSVWYSMLTVVFIPLAVRLRGESSEELSTFRAELLGLSTTIGIVLGIIGCAALTAFLHSSLSGLSHGAKVLAIDIVPWMSLLIPLGVITHWGSVQMMSEGRHGNTLLEGIPALVLLITVLTFPSTTTAPLVWGVVLGAFCHLCAVGIAAPQSWVSKWPRFSMQSSAWRLFWGGMGIMLLGQVLQTLATVVDQLYAAHLEPGSVATVGYSNRIVSLILTLGATAVARATLPVFSGMDRKAIARAASKWAQAMILIGAVVLALGWSSAHWIVGVLFERGEFTSEDSSAVAEVLRYALTHIPFYFAAIVLAYALLGQRRYRATTVLAAVNLFVKIVASGLLIPFLGLNGLMLATTATYMVSCFIAWWLLRVQRDMSRASSG